MSAFPQSGHSDRQILSEIKVRFRPKADIRWIKKTPHRPGSSISAMMRKVAQQCEVLGSLFELSPILVERRQLARHTSRTVQRVYFGNFFLFSSEIVKKREVYSLYCPRLTLYS